MEQIMETAKKQIDELLAAKNTVIVAIDGKCTSGKTTLASKLAEIYDCNVFHILITVPASRSVLLTFS